MSEQQKSISLAQQIINLKHSKKTKLDGIGEMVDWRPIENKLKKSLRRTVNAAGKPAYPGLMMFKCLLLQRLYNLSDIELEESLRDRISFMRFVGLGIDDESPDATTFCRFRNELLGQRICENLFGRILQQFTAQGLAFKEGVIVDASIILSSRRPRKVIECAVVDREETDSPEVPTKCIVTYSDDREAAWTIKGKKFHYGYKLHMAVSADSIFILSGHMTPANYSDTGELEKMLTNIPVKTSGRCYADKGYTSQKNSSVVKVCSLQNALMGKATRNHRLSFWESVRNRCISSVRGGVERVFGTLKRRYRFDRSTYVGQAKVEQEFFLIAMAYNLTRALKLTHA